MIDSELLERQKAYEDLMEECRRLRAELARKQNQAKSFLCKAKQYHIERNGAREQLDEAKLGFQVMREMFLSATIESGKQDARIGAMQARIDAMLEVTNDARREIGTRGKPAIGDEWLVDEWLDAIEYVGIGEKKVSLSEEEQMELILAIRGKQ